MKYIIEIEEKPLCVFDKDTQTYFPRLWRVKGFNSLVLDEYGLSRLEELNSDYINEHFSDLQDTAYQRGFEDGKAVNDKGCEGCKLQGTDSNICDQCCNSYANQWESKDDKIEVGDEVEVLKTGSKYLIAWISGTIICGFSYAGITCRLQPSDVRKTGRHFDIASILEAMKHD